MGEVGMMSKTLTKFNSFETKEALVLELSSKIADILKDSNPKK